MRSFAAGLGLGLSLGLSSVSCTVPTTFACLNSNQCGGGQCIAGGCAFASDACLSGLQYGDLSPEPLAGQCVGIDEGVDESLAEDTTSNESTTLDEESSTSAGSSTSESSTSESSTSESSTSETGTTGSLPDTVIAHYSFDEIDPPVIFDSSGNGFDATMDNLQSSSAAIVGVGLSFGNLDRVIVPVEVLAGRTEFTIEFYMQVAQPAPLRQFLVYYGNELDTSIEPNLTVYVEYLANPKQTARMVWTDNQTTGLIGTTNLRGVQWHHIGLTFSGQGMQLYVDHFLEDEDPLLAGLLDSNLQWIQIGGVPSGFGSFEGILDELRFSEGALTPAEMQPAP